jgi:hypothetical protein
MRDKNTDSRHSSLLDGVRADPLSYQPLPLALMAAQPRYI